MTFSQLELFFGAMVVAIIGHFFIKFRDTETRLRAAENAISSLKSREETDYNAIKCIPQIKSDLAELKGMVSILVEKDKK